MNTFINTLFKVLFLIYIYKLNKLKFFDFEPFLESDFPRLAKNASKIFWRQSEVNSNFQEIQINLKK